MSRLAREMLPALDSLERALATAGEQDGQLLDGLRLVHRELAGALERIGIESFGAAGERFDPELHEAVAQLPADGVPAGEITEVYQAGYRLDGGADPAARPRRRRGLGSADGTPQGPLRRSSASIARPRPRRSRRPTASSRAATTPTPTPTTRTPRPASRRSARPTTSSPTPTSARPTIAARAGSSAAAAAAPTRSPAASTARGSATSSRTSSAARAAPAAGARAPDPSADATSRPRSRSASTRPSHGAQVPLTIPLTERCTTCNGTGARPGTAADRVPALRGPRDRVPGPGHVLDHPAVLALRRQRHGDRVALPDLQRHRRDARRQAPARQHPRRRA